MPRQFIALSVAVANLQLMLGRVMECVEQNCQNTFLLHNALESPTRNVFSGGGGEKPQHPTRKYATDSGTVMNKIYHT